MIKPHRHNMLSLLLSILMLMPCASAARSQEASRLIRFATSASQCLPPCLVERPAVDSSATAVDIALDQQGHVHLVWAHQDSALGYGIYYSARDQSGSWSAPLRLGDGVNPKIGTGNDGVIHVLWVSQQNRMFYRYRSSAGIWSETADLGQTYLAASLAVDSHGGVHILFDCHTGMGCPSNSIFYLERLATGVWQPALAVAEQTPYRALAIGPDGSVHIIWQRHSQGQFYRARGADGQWSDPEKAGGEGYTIHVQSMAIDPKGGIHISFTEPAQGYYLSRVPGGTWTATPLPKAYGSAHLVVDQQGNLYMIGMSETLGESGTFYRYKMLSSDWSEPYFVSNQGSLPAIAVGHRRVHLVEVEGFNNNTIRYRTTPDYLYLPLVRA
jgi:hypothetical protein